MKGEDLFNQFLKGSISRKEFIKRAALLGISLPTVASVLAACAPAPTAEVTTEETAPAAETVEAVPTEAPPTEVKPVWLANSIRSLTNEYHAAWSRGGRLFAESIGMGKYYQVLLSEGNSEKQISDIKALITKGGKDVVFNVDPNQSPDATPIVEACEEAGVYVLTQWNKPDDLHPWDFKYYVAHMAVNGVDAGYAVAKVLLEKMDGKGDIVALQGLLANVPAIERFKGLEKALAEYPDVRLLEEQTGEWDRTKGLNITQTWLTKYGDQIKGIWAANDNMGLGALEALRAAGKAGKVPVVGVDAVGEAVKAIIDGEFVATVSSDVMWQGSYGLALPYYAYKKVFDPTKEPKEHREFYFEFILVTEENAQDYYNNYILSIPQYDWSDLWGRVTGQIQYSK